MDTFNWKIDSTLTFTGIEIRAHLDLLDLLERRVWLEDQGQWDPLELVESVEKLDQRYCLDKLLNIFPTDLSLIPLLSDKNLTNLCS